MSERNDRDDRNGERRGAEGVRIIGAEEAQAALDAGQAAGRRSGDELRYGDVPPVPSGPRPQHRFPLPDSVDPAEAVPRSRVVPPSRVEGGQPVSRGRAVSPEEAHDSRPWHSRGPGRRRHRGEPDPAEMSEDQVVEDEMAEGPLAEGDEAGEPTGVVAVIPADAADEAEAERSPETADAPGAAPDPAGEERGWGRPQTPPEPTGAPAQGDWGQVDWGQEAGASPAHPRGQQDRGWEAPQPGLFAPAAGEAEEESDPTLTMPAVPGGKEQAPEPGAEAPAPARRHLGPAPEFPARPEPYPSPWSLPPQAPAAGTGGPVSAGSSFAVPERQPAAEDPAAAWSARPWATPGEPAGQAPPAERPDAPFPSSPTGEGQPSGGKAFEPAAPPQPPYRGPWSERPASFGAPQPSTGGWSAGTPSFPSAFGGVAGSTGSGGGPAHEGDPPPGPAGEHPSPEPAPGDLAPPDEGITVSGGYGTDLPHWTDPPTGEVPRIFASGQEHNDDELAAWQALGSRGTRWRDDANDWDHVGEFDDLADEEPRLGALDTTRAEHSDLYSFDEEFQKLEEERSGSHRAVEAQGPDEESFDDFGEFDHGEDEPVLVRPGARPATRRQTGARRPPTPPRPGGTDRSGADLGSRAAVGIGLLILLGIAYAVGPIALVVLSAAFVVTAAVEVYGMLHRSGFRPATLLGLVGTGGLMFAAYWRGVSALPLVIAVVFVATMLWYLLGIVEGRPLANVAVTVTAFAWVGVLGSFAALLLRAPHGEGLFIGAVLPAVAADIVAYFVGRAVGSRPLAPSVSPAKTFEGVIGGAVAAIVVGLVIGHSLSPWGGLKHGLALGIVVAVLAPIGDLFESMVKRDLSVKDSGSVLQGHGGVLDRFDSVLLVLPAAYYLAIFLGVLK